MTTSQNGINLIKKSEGCRLTAYQDSVDVWTIGYGHTKGVKEGDTITQAQADEFLIEDIKPCENDINTHVHVQLTQNMFNALVDFAFNLGTGSLNGSTLLKKVNAGLFQDAAIEFDKWIHAGSRVLAGLLARREAEKQLFLS